MKKQSDAARHPGETLPPSDRRNTEANGNVLDVVHQIATEPEAAHAQIALAWLRAQKTVCSVILDVRTMEQLEENLGVAGIDLSGDDLARLDEASALPEVYPYRFIEDYAVR